MGILDFE